MQALETESFCYFCMRFWELMEFGDCWTFRSGRVYSLVTFNYGSVITGSVVTAAKIVLITQDGLQTVTGTMTTVLSIFNFLLGEWELLIFTTRSSSVKWEAKCQSSLSHFHLGEPHRGVDSYVQQLRAVGPHVTWFQL